MNREEEIAEGRLNHIPYNGKNFEYFERDKHISLEVLSGKTLQSQALNYGITRERVRQIVNRFLRMVDAPRSNRPRIESWMLPSFDIKAMRKEPKFLEAIRSLTR